MEVRAGYLFKPSHTEIHYVRKGATGDRRRRYSHNFTTNENEALIGGNKEKAKSVIVKLVSKFKADDEYTWTPVLINVANNSYQRFINGKWLDETISLNH